MNCDRNRILRLLVSHATQSTSEVLARIRRNYELVPRKDEPEELSLILEKYSASLLAPLFQYVRTEASCEELLKLESLIRSYRGERFSK